MTFKEIRLAFAKILNTQYRLEEKQSFYNLLVEHHFGFTRFETHQKDEAVFPEDKLKVFFEAIDRLEKNEPIQYIIGETEFYGLLFKVNRHTLIPRPETEELVAWILEDFTNKRDGISVLDIGTGSGCISISLAKERIAAKVSGVDISEGALNIAVKNAQLNKVEVAFKQQDILTLETLPARYDIIVSNPPYVRALEKEKMMANVLEHEPQTALFVSNDDPLIFYRKIAQLAYHSLEQDGALYFEINEFLAEEMMDLLKQIGFTACLIKKDIYGMDRMMRARI